MTAESVTNPTDLALRLLEIVLYEDITKKDPLKSLIRLLETEDDASQQDKMTLYRDFLGSLYNEGGDLGNYLLGQVRSADNIYVRLKAESKPIPASMQACFEREMETFTLLSKISSDQLLILAGLDEDCPGYETTPFDFTQRIPELLKDSSTYGYGMYARYSMFRVDKDGKIVPILSPDPITIDQLIGYEQERGQVLNNVYALLEGRPAANMLLVGDAGTGKSSTVKAIVNQLCGKGVRLIEMRKDQLELLPDVSGQIASNPLRFIIFIDDLSFESEDPAFGALKAILEGSAAAKTPNAIICATSNRRHIVKETFSSREGDEIHRRDTIEEQTSLSARFGLTVLFVKPNKDLYLKIVKSLCQEAVQKNGADKAKGVIMDDTELFRRAEVFAIHKGGRSARVARQFVDSLLSQGSILTEDQND